ncbi:MAG TPA: type II secretion system protein [Candidatus Saccharimonas sp.]|nr:type II secretion system protein [Candidatus Saccharimonas sp.]
MEPQRGSTIIEVLVIMALSAILIPAIFMSVAVARSGRANSAERVMATGLLREASEATRVVWAKDWSGIATNGTYHPAVSGSSWVLAAGSESINEFTRQVVISDAQRDSGGQIVAAGGAVDPATKHVTMSVSWGVGSVSAEAYFTRYTGNQAWTQTTQSDFDGGTLTNTATTNSAGGEVILGAGSGVPYQLSGTYESPSFDAGSGSAFNHLAFAAATPAGTTITLQIASNDDNATWSYVGPDGTAGTSYSSGGPIALAAVSGRYFRYRATLTSADGTNTPTLQDTEVDYTP